LRLISVDLFVNEHDVLIFLMDSNCDVFQAGSCIMHSYWQRTRPTKGREIMSKHDFGRLTLPTLIGNGKAGREHRDKKYDRQAERRDASRLWIRAINSCGHRLVVPRVSIAQQSPLLSLGWEFSLFSS